MRVGRLRGMMHPVKPRLRASLIAIGLPLLLLFATSAAATTATYTGSVSSSGVKWQFKTLSVAGSGPLTARLTWSTPTAQLQVGLSHKNADGTWTWVGGARAYSR